MVRGTIIVLLLAAIGCGSDGYKPGEVSCEFICERKAAPACAQMPSTYLDDCKEQCAASRTSYPTCATLMDAAHACVANKVTFQCDAEGYLLTLPAGACASEGLACDDCTDDPLACF